MDQDAFRRLLSTGTQKQNGSQHARSSLSSKARDEQKRATNDPSSKAAFKPRKVKKQVDSAYRDRATERRTGAAGDFAEVEAVLESFEKQNANEDKEIVEERRKYLGGDAEHSVLVKGLDFALLEQTKARLAASEAAQGDEELEEAFRGIVSSTSAPLEGTSISSAKKRTREDIVRELKNKRTKGEANGQVAPVEEKSLEEVKREGKFKPIGSKPIGGSSAKANSGKEVKKKRKKKVAEDEANGGIQGASAEASHQSERKEGPDGSKARQDSQMPAAPAPILQLEPELEPVNEDFDIFADAGEYEGIDLGDDDEDLSSDKDLDVSSSKREDRPPESRTADDSTREHQEPSEPRPKRKWIEDDEDEPLSPPRDRSLPPADSRGKRKESPPRSETSPIARKSPSGSPRESDTDEPEPESSEKLAPLTRLAPLASSAVPSIRDILAADSALEAEKRRKARREKQKHKRGGGGDGGEGGEGKKVSSEAKLNREYQKLKSYTEKKGGGGL